MKKVNKEQKRLMSLVARLPCANCLSYPVEVHHCAGRSAKHNKVEIGHFWLLPLCVECHRGDHGIHGDMGRYHRNETRKEVEKRLFENTIKRIDFDFPEEVLEAIRDYRR